MFKLFKRKKSEQCKGCNMAQFTKGISCDTCIDGSNYGVATEDEFRDLWSQSVENDKEGCVTNG